MEKGFFDVGLAVREVVRTPELAPKPQLPAVLPKASSTLQAGVAAVKRAEDAFAAVASAEAEYAKHPIRGFEGRYPGSGAIIGLSGLALGIGAAVCGFIWDWNFLWLIAPGVAAIGAAVGLEGMSADLKAKKEKTALESKDVEPLVATLRGATVEDRALMRLFVEQHTNELETAGRLTTKAAHTLREAIRDSATDAAELTRASFIVSFAERCRGTIAKADLDNLQSTLRAASSDERVGAAEFLENKVFPKEKAPAHFDAETARTLFAIIALARKGEVAP